MTTHTYNNVDELPDIGGEEPKKKVKSVDDLPDLTVKKKETTQSLIGQLPSQIGGETSTAVIKPSEKFKAPSIEDYNKRFEEVTGHKEFDLGSDLPQIKKAREEKKYTEYRNIEEKELKPVADAVVTGTVQPSQLSNLYNKPYGKKIVGQIINNEVPELGSMALEENVYGADKKWEDIASAIQFKNRPQGIEAQQMYEQNLDLDISQTIGHSKLGKNLGAAETRHGGGVNEYSFDEINPNNPQSLRKALDKLEEADYITSEGEERKTGQVDNRKQDLIDKIRTKLIFLKSREQIPEEIERVTDNIGAAVDNINSAGWKRQSLSDQQISENIEKDKSYVKAALNYLKDENPAKFGNIMAGIVAAGKIADTDYSEVLIPIGKKILEQQDLVSGQILREDNRDFSTHQTRRADLSLQLSERLKQMGYRNQGKIPDKAIIQAAETLPGGIRDMDQEALQAIRKDEANGGYGIVKGGGLTAFMRGIAGPIKSIQQTLLAEDPVSTYLNSRRYDYGDQVIPDAEGNYSDVLPSERKLNSWKNFFNKGLEGAGQFGTQVLLARGFGKVLEAPYSAAARFVPRAALTAEQSTNIAAYGGGFISTALQTYGSSYIDFLNKTGNPNKASLMALIDTLGQSALETLVLPDVKIAESMKGGLKTARENLAKGIIGVIEGGGKQEAIKPFLQTFLKETGTILGKEVVIEENLQNVWNYFTESLFSPKTAKDRNLSEETNQVIKEAGVQMLVPALLGGFGESKGKAVQKFNKDALHTSSINFDQYKDYLDNSLLHGTITEDEHNRALNIMSLHKGSIENAPKRDSNGDPISSERQLEYAFQNTVSEINQALASSQTDKVQREPFEKKVEEADKIKRKIFYGEGVKDLPKQEPEEKPVSFDNDEELLNTIKEFSSESLQGQDMQFFVDQASNAPQQFIDTYGEVITDKLLEKATTEQLKKSRDDAMQLGIQSSVEKLDKVIAERGTTTPALKEQVPQVLSVSGKEVIVSNSDFKDYKNKNPQGIDLKKVGDDLMGEFNDGDKVEFFAEKKRNGIWDGKRQMIVDENGNPWGITAILNDPSGYIKKESKQPTNEAAIQEPIKVDEPISPKEELVTETISDTGGKGAEPPIPPKEPPVKEEGEKDKLNEKGILNHLYKAKRTPEAAKEGFKAEGLKYQTKSQEEAQNVAKAVLDEVGIDEGVLLAEAQKFDGDVNSLIFAEALNRLKEQEDSATTPEGKLEAAKKFAEVGITYDKMARYGGRFNAAINYFYKKSPLGIVMMENAKRKEDFEEWSKPKDKSWQEFFDELMKEPEFEAVVKEQVKKERADERQSRKEKVHKAIDETLSKWAKKLSIENKDDVKKQGVGDIDVIMKAVGIAMKKAYDAGEAVVKIVRDAIDYISEKIGTTEWNSEDFREEWEKKLQDKPAKKKLTDAEVKTKILDKFRKKLKGLSDKQKDEVVRKAFNQIVESGGLDYEDFRKIIGSVTGRGELTPEEMTKMKELVTKLNSVEDAVTTARTERTESAIKKLREVEFEAGKASRELNELIYNKPDITKRLTSIMQLNTLGIPALINNPIYNVWNQLTLRYPIGLFNSLIDRASSNIANAFGKKYDRQYNTSWAIQKEFFRKLGFGAKESFIQLGTGLNRQDYIQKEVYGQQIRPARAWRDLFGKKKLTGAQIFDKTLQGTVGVPAEIIARTLNLGDKPQRFAAEGAQAASFAKTLGLKDIDYKLFIEFPREEAYAQYKKKGLSDAEAGVKADFIRDAIIKEGKRSTFQQDNLLTDVLNRAFGVIGGKESGASQLAKTVLISPYIKIPSNAYWSYYNLVNPEIAILQSMIHAGRARALRSKEDSSSRLAEREARYWFAHAAVGMAMRGVVIALVRAGVFIPANTGDESKKEREGEGFFEPQGTVNITKLAAILRGEDPTKIKGGVTISNRWFGQWGTVGNTIARKYEDMTPEQREKQTDLWDLAFGGLEIDALKDLEQGVFGNTSSLLSALNDSGSYGWQRYGLNTINMFANIIQPAAFAQISRAELPYYSTTKAKGFMEQLKNSMLQRSSVIRSLFNQYPPSKINIWGETMNRPGNTLEKLFGVNVLNGDNFAQPIYEDAKTNGDIGFFPPATMPILNDKKLTIEQQRKRDEYVGKARASYVAPFINDQAEISGFNVLYSQLSPGNKKFVLGYLYELGREDGDKKLVEEFPDLKKKETEIDYTKEIQKDLFKILHKYKK